MTELFIDTIVIAAFFMLLMLAFAMVKIAKGQKDFTFLRGILFITVLTGITCTHAAEPKDDEQPIEILYQQASKAHREKKLEACLTLCEQIMDKDPAHAGAINLTGAVYVELRDFERAKKFFALAHRANPSVDIKFNLAEMDFLARNWQQAEKDFQHILEPNDAKGLIKPLSRFKLMIIALHQKDMKALKAHHAFFKEAEMKRELAFYEVLQEIHTKNLDEDKARALWRPLRQKYQDTAIYIDSLLEAYYMQDDK